MVKTTKNVSRKNISKKNVSKKNVLSPSVLKLCPIGLEPFEEKFGKTFSKNELKRSSALQKKTFVKELLSRFSPNNIKPENDFYDYINYNWLQNVSLEERQKYIVQIDDFRLAQDKVYLELKAIILDYIKSHNNQLSKNLKYFYDSVIKMNSVSDSKKLSIEAVQTIDTFIQEKNVWKLLGFINSDEMIAYKAPFVWSVSPDNKEPTIFRCYINAHQFALIDINVYYDDGTEIEYKKNYRNHFKKCCKKLFDTCLGTDHGFDPADVYDVEVEIFNVLGCNDVTKTEKTYNRVTKDEALTEYGFDWKELSEGLGFKTTPTFFITSSLNYLKCGSELLKTNWDTPKWRTYWVWILLNRIARVTKEWEEISYEMFGRYERGQQEINDSNAVSASLYMSIPFNTFLTNQYMEKYSNPQITKYAETICTDLKLVFKRILMRNTWLQPKTKKYALHKLDKFSFVIGKPEHLREDPDLDYGDNLYDNMSKINKWRHKKFVDLVGQPYIDIPMMDWSQYPVKMTGTQAYIVNASYTPSKNCIYINQGYLQKPFIDLELNIEYNLAHIGFTLGHEMSHGFDDWGSQYNI
jgi:putative endopeptidase